MKETFKLNRHYTYTTGRHISRKLFLCHRCDSKCSPSEYRSFVKVNKLDYYIATCYDCGKCGLRFIVNNNLFDTGTYRSNKRF